MTLPAGTRLGPYEILAPLGAGGMGEVYRARDTRLGREVAIKVLPAELSSNRERLHRFEQEARAASALNHPNIVTVHDIGEVDSAPYIAMELVEGKTVRELIVSGPLPVRKLLAIAAQVAEGLAKAHAAGIVHRDLKPENLMVSSDGFVKILDFGLAKLVPDASDALSRSPTVARPETHPGTVLGTVGYMSPEQAAGQPLDFRSDQFSFSSILYEMATGKRAFERTTTVDTLAAILHEEPEPIARISPAVPAPLRWIVERCLEKDPRSRYASTLDLARELASVRDHVSELSGGASALSPETRHRFRGRLFAGSLAAAAMLIGLAAGYLLRGRTAGPPASASRMLLNLALAPGEELVLAAFPSLAISPDGSRLVYRGRTATGDALYIRSLDSLDAKPLPGTEGGLSPFFSADGAWVGFGADGKLKKISLSGGQPLTICDAPILRGASWGVDGTILFAPTTNGGLSRVPENGGEAKPVTTLDRERGERTHRFPRLLPGGKVAIFTAHDLTGDYDRARIEAVSLETGKRQVVLEGGTDAHYVDTGHLLYLRGSALYAVAFDAHGLRTIGSPAPVLDGVGSFSPAGFAHVALSSGKGPLVYRPIDPRAAERDLAWMDRNGATRPLTDARRPFSKPRLSPDGRRLAVSVADKGVDIWVYDIPRNAWEQLTSERINYGPVWSPDGRRIAFSSNRAGMLNLFVLPTDRSAPPQQLTKGEGWPYPQAWAPDGRSLLVIESPRGDVDLAQVSLDGNGEPKPLLRLPGTQESARISPDGAWMVYQSDESGRSEVYLARYPAPSGRTQVSTEGGTEPAWSPNGREVFLRKGNTLMVATVELLAEPRVGAPRVLFEKEFEEFDPAPDGQSFVVVRRAHPNLPPRPLVAVLGWSEDLERRVPAQK